MRMVPESGGKEKAEADGKDGHGMSKPKMYGMNTSYIPNAKADTRYRKKVYQRGREKPTIIRENQKVEQSREGKA